MSTRRIDKSEVSKNLISIALFLLPLCALGAGIFLTSQSFIHFAIVAVAYSIYFPLKFGILPQDEADYIYYLLGIAGLAFFYQTQVISQEEYLSKVGLSESSKRLILLDELDTDPARFLEREEIKRAVFDSLKSVFYTESNPNNDMFRDCASESPEDPRWCDERQRLEDVAARLATVGVPLGSMVVSTVDAERLLGSRLIEVYSDPDETIPSPIRLPAVELYNYYRTPPRSNELGNIDVLRDDINQVIAEEREWQKDFESQSSED